MTLGEQRNFGVFARKDGASARAPKVIFHLGFQKTGTTSIQALLNANKIHLADIDVRAYGDATKDLRVAGREFCKAPSIASERKLIDALKHHYSAARDSGKSTYLISDENILGRVPFGETGDIISWGERILPLIESCASGVKIGFHFYTRDADAWRKSTYRQCVKRAGVSSSYENWVKAAPFASGWPRWEDWSVRLANSVSAPITFTSMDEELRSGAILGTALLKSVGVSEAELGELTVTSPRNPALSDTAIRVMRMVNRIPLKERTRLRISERVEGFDLRFKRQ